MHHNITYLLDQLTQVAKPYPTIVFFGGPGSGKNTQGILLAEYIQGFHFSLGDVIRRLPTESELAHIYTTHATIGRPVPDEFATHICERALYSYVTTGQFRPPHQKLILDGYPKSFSQANHAEKFLNLLCVVHLRCSDELALERIKRRNYIDGRIEDQTEDVIINRIRYYHEEVEPVLRIFRHDSILSINAEENVQEVLQQILNGFESFEPLNKGQYK